MSLPAITVLYATMSGNSMDCAHQVAGRLAREGHAVAAVDLARYPAGNILKERIVLICISTWGEGEPPDDAVEFIDFLNSLDAGDLRELRFSVLALGDYNYEQFCQCGRDLDALLERLGARRMVDRVDADVHFEPELAAWSDAVSEVLSGRSALPSANPSGSGI